MTYLYFPLNFVFLFTWDQWKGEKSGNRLHGVGNKWVKSAKGPINASFCGPQMKNYILTKIWMEIFKIFYFLQLLSLHFPHIQVITKCWNIFLENILNNLLHYLPWEIKCEFFNVHLRHLYWINKEVKLWEVRICICLREGRTYLWVCFNRVILWVHWAVQILFFSLSSFVIWCYWMDFF